MDMRKPIGLRKYWRDTYEKKPANLAQIRRCKNAQDGRTDRQGHDPGPSINQRRGTCYHRRNIISGRSVLSADVYAGDS